MPKHNWKSTALFKELERKSDIHSESIKNLLNSPKVMDKIELILDKGNTTPKDFTLHDSDHSYRVAERIWDLIPQKTQLILSPYELGLLLLSAYLHDIGMSPDFEKVERHRDYLILDIKNQLEEEEINEFQKWIDNDSKIQSINIRNEIISDKKLINSILSYYVRHKHNDWSGNWIESNIAEFDILDYFDWVDDLITLCKSHHYDLSHLAKDVFNPKPLAGNMTVHLRYLAMCLRSADVMENDPERTPEVILKHRNIDDSSLKFWLKDHQFSLTKRENAFSIYARPIRAYLHKAIEETANWIENELRLCNELTKLRPLSYASFGELSQYLWDVEAFVYRDIQPKQDSYIYIQGGFRPNTAKILELLGGNQLYGHSIWAYRELLQNSFDAIKERIAYQIIEDGKAPKELSEKLGSIFSIELELVKKEDGIWLICKDQGVGMTKSIIEKFFLESGSSKRHEINDLERKCKAKGFTFTRTGQFGIGVLSYFMLADKITVITKRELNTGYHDHESSSLYFEINGAQDFGELRSLNKAVTGTQVFFKLKYNIEEDIKRWDSQFKSFLKEEVAYSPCTITYKSFTEDTDQRLIAGWSNNIQDIKSKIVEIAKDEIFGDSQNDSVILSLKEKTKRDEKYLLGTEALQEIKDNVEFICDEGEIPDMGRYRIHVPYFKLTKGNCYFYMKEDVSKSAHKIYKINKGFFYCPRFDGINFSLKGMKIHVQSNSFRSMSGTLLNFSNCFVEIDIQEIDTSGLSISRHNLIIKEKYDFLVQFIQVKIHQLINDNKMLFNSFYGNFNKYVDNVFEVDDRWIFGMHGDDEIAILRSIKYPISESHYLIGVLKKLSYNNKTVDIVSQIISYGNIKRLKYLDKIKPKFLHCEIYTNGSTNPFDVGGMAIITERPSVRLGNKFFVDLIELPLSWNNILLLDVNTTATNHTLLNANHCLISLFNEKDLIDIHQKGNTISIEDLSTKQLCYNLLIYYLLHFKEERWIGLCEQRSDLIRYMFRTLEIDSTYYKDSKKCWKISFAVWVQVNNEMVFNYERLEEKYKIHASFKR